MKIFTRMILFATLAIITLSFRIEARGKMIPWNTDIKPGDKVCVYDIAEHDPLVDLYDNSLKYTYRSNRGDQKSVRQLRPMVRKLLLMVAWPGLRVSATPDKIGQYWYSGWAVVLKGGHRLDAGKSYEIKRGKNTLISQGGRSWIMPAHMLHFTHVRLVKKKGFLSCQRTYETF